MNKASWIIMALAAGAFLPIQAGLNAKMGKAGQSAVHASTISFVVGTIALIAYILIARQSVSWSGLKAAPPYAWLGGLLGAFYVTVIVLAFPKLGPGLTFGLVVTGQLFLSLIMEHYQILGAHAQAISIPRIIGMLLVIAGVIIMKKF